MTDSGECVICVANQPKYTQKQYDDLVNKYVLLADKYAIVNDKYCEALNKISELKGLI